MMVGIGSAAQVWVVKSDQGEKPWAVVGGWEGSASETRKWRVGWRSARNAQDGLKRWSQWVGVGEEKKRAVGRVLGWVGV